MRNNQQLGVLKTWLLFSRRSVDLIEPASVFDCG